MIARFLKGIFNRHPPLPKYVDIWDINKVLDFYKTLPDNKQLSLKEITQKLAMLLLILGARRKQTLLSILIDNVKITDNDMTLIPHEVQKHNKPGKPIKPIIYKRFRLNTKLCVVGCMSVYLVKRQTLVSQDIKSLFITYGTPHKPATNDTISRWIKNELQNAGIDTQTFKPHSCRAAATSKAKQIGIPLKEIIKRGSWSSDSTFKKFYDKDIINSVDEEHDAEFVSTILSQVNN